MIGTPPGSALTPDPIDEAIDVQRELTGQIDDVRIYDRALSAAEVLYITGQ